MGFFNWLKVFNLKHSCCIFAENAILSAILLRFDHMWDLHWNISPHNLSKILASPENWTDTEDFKDTKMKCFANRIWNEVQMALKEFVLESKFKKTWKIISTEDWWYHEPCTKELDKGEKSNFTKLSFHSGII